MRYSLYKDSFEDFIQFRLYLKMQDGNVALYTFNTQDHMISNHPNATRWFGTLTFLEDDYFLFPIQDNGISVGEYEILQLHEKFIKIRFLNGLIEGEWFLRNIRGGEVLFWKPAPEGFVCEMKNTEISEEVSFHNTENLKIKQAFGAHLIINDRIFSGPCISAGIATGLDRISVLFTTKFLEKLEKKMLAKITELIVDIDHEFLVTGDKEAVNTGSITKVQLKKNNEIDFIWCEGQTTHALPGNAGLSITMETELEWNDELNIFMAVDADPIGVSITDKIVPACKICWVQ